MSLIVNIISRASELGKPIRHTKRFHEIALDENKLTMRELKDLCDELQTDGKTLLGGNQIDQLAKGIDVKDMLKTIEILKRANKRLEESDG